MMIEIGRVCVKTAGRDATKHAVIVDVLEDNRVLLDGNVRRRVVSLTHVEPLNRKVSVKKGAETQEVLDALDKLNIKPTKKAEKRQAKEQKKQQRRVRKHNTQKKAKKKSAEGKKEESSVKS